MILRRKICYATCGADVVLAFVFAICHDVRFFAFVVLAGVMWILADKMEATSGR